MRKHQVSENSAWFRVRSVFQTVAVAVAVAVDDQVNDNDDGGLDSFGLSDAIQRAGSPEVRNAPNLTAKTVWH